MTETRPAPLHIIMGPAACGKSSIAGALAARMQWPMIEADDHHPQANIAKMSNGIALTDNDRIAWLDSLVDAIKSDPTSPLVLACSALTPYVQSRLREDTDRPCVWWLIDLSRDVLERRIRARTDHFMPPELIASQLASLVPPTDAVKINGDRPIDKICDDIVARL